MKTPLFELSADGNSVQIDFKNVKTANTFGKMDFFSRLLHSLAPDQNRVWRESPRLDAEISGWPKNIKWQRTGETTFSGTVTAGKLDSRQYSQILETALDGVMDGEENAGGTRMFRFLIGNGKEWLEYRFHSKSRTIAALCVLYDLEAHPRNDLEINIPKKFGPQNKWPIDNSSAQQRTYGDPSKTADELRNEGWSRFGDALAMKVFRERVGGQIQQMYQLTKKDQSVGSQMMRSNISKKWRDELYKSQDYTCQICLHKYGPELLEPDHRIPVIYQADRLTDENFKEKLMTLCRFCNQQKRETTKRLTADYDWANSEWAFPEKFDLEIIRKRIELYKKRTGKSKKEVLAELDK